MERAAKAIFNYLNDVIVTDCFEVYCGQGNNGGDGLAVARMLASVNKKVKVYIIKEKEKGSLDYDLNFEQLKKIKQVECIEIISKIDLINPERDVIIIDALLGTGLKQMAKGLTKDAIDFLNEQKNEKIAIDIPSGLLCDEPALEGSSIVKATVTLSFQFMKLAFLFPENYQYTGKIKLLDIGLSQQFIIEEKTKHYFTDQEGMGLLMPSRQHFAHKGNFGHALLLAGSNGKNGAALLAAKAGLKSGAGLLTVHSGNNLQNALNCYLPSAMFNADTHKDFISELPDLSRYTAVGIGCGIGNEVETSAVLKLLIQQCKVPLVIDADALNILAENKTWLSFLPPSSILTPHPKEFERLCGKWSNSFERLQLQKDFSSKYNCYVVFKGAYTCISTPLGNCYFNSTGNAGMAKGGSGDVLTGIITALLAQGIHQAEACILGVYVHGLAGDMAQQKLGQVSMLPEDLIDNLGEAFMQIQSNL
jgi:NAD(P)H-hydrate epimerase